MDHEQPIQAVIIGASGGIGAALAAELERRGQRVRRLGRRTLPALDLLDEASIARAAAETGPGQRLVLDATGFLHDGRFQPEKSFRQLDPAHMARSFALNATGPALLMKHFLPLLARDGRAVFATLSARVGSITDNRLGGWTSYRAAKAALNQIMRTTAIELARTRPQAICVSLHPGTVDTALSAPFAKAGLEVQPPEQAAARLLDVLDGLTPAESGGFFDHHGRPIPF
ncbi:SDR family NAD(P)-dependent oxidoreductase [Sediminicoccus rosea]|jgi:NAD(P)-dependent dehydrogenase (short-subunit alcohol dehydrogenase family)|uniref:SDR family NAD(P)-dependent oxidoreductase n=1 Tax=Sediminicoccus rosea TaxID=1225128 RepID=A0ABZ0PHH9_9PROT|nr:SDR family NAD(P)-dependent oxidoreductase [Sediminicoccus rosea]WPB84837.1 SDR family NAD(P)-dependent oxidoreductase [Sediminicoccus rosea]